MLSKRKLFVKYYYMYYDVSNEKFTSKIFYCQTYLVTYVQNGKRLWISRRPVISSRPIGCSFSAFVFCCNFAGNQICGGKAELIRQNGDEIRMATWGEVEEGRRCPGGKIVVGSAVGVRFALEFNSLFTAAFLENLPCERSCVAFYWR